MKRRSFYFYALWLPLVLQLLAWLIVTLWMNRYGNATPSEIRSIAYWLASTGLLSGTQYLLFALVVSFWFARDDIAYIESVHWWLPLLFIPFCTIGLWILSELSPHHSTAQGADFSLFISLVFYISIVAIPCGYAYLFLTHAVLAVLEKTGVVKE